MAVQRLIILRPTRYQLTAISLRLSSSGLGAIQSRDLYLHKLLLKAIDFCVLSGNLLLLLLQLVQQHWREFIVAYSVDIPPAGTSRFSSTQPAALTCGDSALISNTTGSFNTAFGSSAIAQNATGTENTASGWFALYSNTIGNYNTASGYDALRSNTSGSGNTASGYDALQANSTGNDNTASGYFSLYSNTTGSNNTASGFFALLNNTRILSRQIPGIPSPAGSRGS
jgi:hypothetical protein